MLDRTISIPDHDPYVLERFPRRTEISELDRRRYERRIITAYRAGMCRHPIALRTGWHFKAVKDILARAQLIEWDREAGLMALWAVHVSDLVWRGVVERGEKLEQTAARMEMFAPAARRFYLFAKVLRRNVSPRPPDLTSLS
ncbi:hypothetical protein [Allokutzneria sp. NRRL B-24872]|uniref:hypothetical protein n=1 Tax=Allokutzneria sp. NRRL B-24872 TaxID=1137961 RepID=UPI000A3C048C|nr:hypothetical protein [Allokutzneria sp. NRRL B-24872]